MNDKDAEIQPLGSRTIPLLEKHALDVHRGVDNCLVRVINDDKILLSLVITPGRIVLNVAPVDVALETTGKLDIHAEHIRMHGQAGVAITTNGDMQLHATGDIRSDARAQNISATLGDVRVSANDDVILHGERIKLNA